MRDKVRTKSVLSVAIVSVLLFFTLTGLSPTLRALPGDSLTGAIWTSDPHGERVNGNLYKNARDVYLAGGPHKLGAACLEDGIYFFQVTDQSGKTLYSTDDVSARRFEVVNGVISSVPSGGTHKWNYDTTRGIGIVVQLWPFKFSPKTGGEYKAWVTKADSYTLGQGCFGFIPSCSKTDNFKVKVDEASKCFELWVTQRISEPATIEFYVNFTLDADGDPGTFDPISPWTTGQLVFAFASNGYDVFSYETSFEAGSLIYWQFFTMNEFEWTSSVGGPELIDQAGVVNKEIIFVVSGFMNNHQDSTGIEGWTVELYKDGAIVASTTTDCNGYFEIVGSGVGTFEIREVRKNDEGWECFGSDSYQFTVDCDNAVDPEFDFSSFKMLRLTDSSDERIELSSFGVVITPSGDGSGYKLSSTNPGSFYTYGVMYGTAGNPVRFEIGLPPSGVHGFDSPNFILHHTYIGSIPVVDVHVYAGRLASPSGWVPDWASDVTDAFEISVTPDGKLVMAEGIMPLTGEAVVTVHIDFQIDSVMSYEQVQLLRTFEYTFTTLVEHSIHGVTLGMPVYD